MRKLMMSLLFLGSISSIHAQTAVGVPHFVGPGTIANKWQVTDVANVQQARGKFIESKTLKGADAGISFRDFHFTIPAGAAVQGIDVRVTRKKKGPNDVKDLAVSLLKPVGDTGSAKTTPNLAQESFWTDGLTTVLYSFPSSAVDSDGFSFLWTAEELNHPAFGLSLETSIGNTGKGASALIDKIELTVRYTEPVSTTAPAHYTGKKPLFKNLGRKYEVNIEKEGDYLFIVRNSTGHIVQQTQIQGGRTVIVPLNEKSKGRCIITVQGRDYKMSEQAVLQ